MIYVVDYPDHEFITSDAHEMLGSLKEGAHEVRVLEDNGDVAYIMTIEKALIPPKG